MESAANIDDDSRHGPRPHVRTMFEFKEITDNIVECSCFLCLPKIRRMFRRLIANSPIHSMPSCFIASNKWDARNYISLIVHLALVANDKQKLQDTLDEWNGLFTRHGQKLRIEKTKVLHVGHRREGRAEHRAGGEETVSGGQFRVSRRGSVWRWKDGERGTSKSTRRSERVESRTGESQKY